MDNLTKLSHRWSGVSWVGARRHVNDDDIVEYLMSMVGYSHPHADFSVSHLITVDRIQAARILDFVSTKSLAYGLSRKASEAVSREILDALNDLSSRAMFLSNGTWGEGHETFSWLPLTQSTFDAGIIGYDYNNAFIFWREEED